MNGHFSRGSGFIDRPQKQGESIFINLATVVTTFALALNPSPNLG